jgi:cytochrome-b5 reductase
MAVATASPGPISLRTAVALGLLQKDKYSLFEIESIRDVVNCKVFRFRLEPDVSLGIGLGNHVRVQIADDKGEIARSYTPISLLSAVGFFEIMVKVYPQGRVGPSLAKLLPSDKVLVCGPTGGFKYETGQFTHLGFVVGGSGLTPALQVIQAILANSAQDSTKLKLIFSNSTENDVLLKEHLDRLASAHPEQLTITYVVTRPTAPAEWFHAGRFTKEFLQAELPAPSSTVRIAVCGPSQHNKDAIDMLTELGHAKDNVVKF